MQSEEKNKALLTKGRVFICMFAIALMGLILRMYNLAKFGLWFDEAIFPLLINLLQKESLFLHVNVGGHTPILFTLLLRAWMHIASNDFFLRSFSVIWAVFSIVAIYKLGEIIFSKRVGILSALFLSISPLHIYYSQELTHYSLSILFAIFSSYCFIRFLKYKDFYSSIFYVLSTLAFIYIFPVNLLIFPVQNIFFFMVYYKDKYLRRRWLILQIITFLLSLYWMLFIVLQVVRFHQLNIYSWIPRPSPNALLQTFMVFSLGYHASWALQLTALIIVIYFSVTAIYYWRKENEIFYLVSWLVFPVGIVWLVSQLQPFYLHRVFCFSLPAFYLLMAAGLINISKQYLRRRMVITAFYIILAIYSLGRYYENRLPYDYKERYTGIYPKKDYRRPATVLAKKFKDGDIILHISRSSFIPFIYYHGQRFPEYGIKLNDIYKDDWVRNRIDSNHDCADLLAPIAFLEIKEKSDLGGYKRIWLVYSSWSFLENSNPKDKIGNKISYWFRKNFPKRKKYSFDGATDIYLFSN